MIIPSVKEIFSSAFDVFKRFPLAVLAAYGVTLIVIELTHSSYGNATQEILAGIAFTAVFAFPFTMALDLFCESKKMSLVNQWILRLASLVVLGALYFSVFGDFAAAYSERRMYEVLFLNASAWALFIFSAFTASGRQNAFWQFVVGVFVRLLFALVLFGVLFLGISALMASIDYLFDVNIDEDYYLDLWLVIAGMLATVFVMAWIPKDVQKLERETNYPKSLRILIEYFLIPLVSLYMLVLYVYCAKILVTLNWPKGGVGLWIIAFSTVGVVSYFFAHSAKENFSRYVEFFKKWFFAALIPLLFVLFLAIGIRMQAYGVTVDRYLVVLFGIWLLVMSVYFLASKAKALKFIPITLFVLLLVAAYGPQSAFEVSTWSQEKRMESLFEKYGLLEDGKFLDDPKEQIAQISDQDSAQIYSIVRYLSAYNDVEFFQQWFRYDLEKKIMEKKNCKPEEDYCKISSWDVEDEVLRFLDLSDAGYYNYEYYDAYTDDYDEESVPAVPDSGGNSTFTYYVDFQREESCASGDGLCAMEVSGFDYYASTYVYGDEKRVVHAGRSYMVYLSGDKQETFSLVDGEKVILSTDLSVLFNELVATYGKKSFRNVPADKMTIIFPRGQFNIATMAARYDKDDNLVSVDSLSGELLLKK